MLEKTIKIHNILHGNDKNKLYLFGASVTGGKVYEKIKQYSEKVAMDNIGAFVDNNETLWGTRFYGKKVLSRKELKEQIKDGDIVLISSNKFIPISIGLEEIGICNYVKCDELFVSYCYQYGCQESVQKTPWESALSWILNNIMEEGGIRATSAHHVAYPEVTGYIIPTLMQYGHYQEAKQAVKWLLGLQKEDGGFPGIPGTDAGEQEFVFDSGQILRGLLKFTEDEEIKGDIRISIEKVCGYLMSQMIENGKKGFQIQYANRGFEVETILIYVLPPLKKAAQYLNQPFYSQAADFCLDYYKKHKDFLTTKTLTHFLAYQLEALIELDSLEEINSIFEYFEKEEVCKGFIPGVKEASWTCSTGNAQIAKCCFMTGRNQLGHKLISQLEEVQLLTGGFMGSYGTMPEYFPATEISWANKYFLDACKLQIKEWFNDNAGIFPEHIKEDDAEFQAVLKYIKSGMSIADIGCGKGRFLKMLFHKVENLSLTGVDISEAMISSLPEYVVGKIGVLEEIPLDTDQYDITLCIEAIEHSIDVEKAVYELIRITKPGGRVILIDKNKKHWGRMECPSWERWYDKDRMLSYFMKNGIKAQCKIVDLFGQKNDDMFLMWVGIKPL